eukprot:TRINITY_DN3489_c0_g1_i2.p1 TRINITY_DN3489_c0_g1~~TRINITY_DN3489_c0_g1_i2.p1  ORF type:complete len:109 (-),score=15.90 TRINITY_DN3489_c0_g1_i2:109-435(-)
MAQCGCALSFFAALSLVRVSLGAANVAASQELHPTADQGGHLPAFVSVTHEGGLAAANVTFFPQKTVWCVDYVSSSGQGSGSEMWIYEKGSDEGNFNPDSKVRVSCAL